MKKKILFLLVVVVTILATVFLGCPTGGSGTGGPGDGPGDDDEDVWTPPVDDTEVWPIVTDDPAGSRVYFLAPTGDDSTGDGSMANPWFSLTRAQDVVNPGDTVYLRAGKYEITTTYGTQSEVGVNGSARTRIVFNKSGTDGSPITYAGYPGDLPARPVLDFSTWVVAQSGTRRSCAMAIGTNSSSVKADWIWLRGFDVTGLKDYTNASNANGYVIQLNNGSHNTFENLRIYNCAGTGVFSFSNWTVAYNLIKNCDFFQLHSLTNPPMNQNTDGGGFHISASNNSVANVFYGCRAWAVGDDGFDSIRAGSRVVYDHSWIAYTAYNYKFGEAGDPDYDDWTTKLDIDLLDYNGGNGNGLKLGGYGMSASTVSAANGWNGKNPGHVLRYCLAIGNHRAGVTHNYAAGSGQTGTDGQSYFNTTAYNNRINFEMITQAPETTSGGGARRRNAHSVTMKRNISYKNLELGDELYELIDYVPETEPQEYPVRWLDFESGVIEDNTFGVADNGGKETHALDGVFASSGTDTTDFDDRGGAYTNGAHAVKDIVQYLFPITDNMFLSLDEDLFLAPRKKNGDLPETELLRPLASSPMADMGYTAPDNNDDGFRDFWKYSGATPLLDWNGFTAAFPAP
jgi:hypothetical protein